MFLLRVDVPLGHCRTEVKYDTLADLPLSLRYSRHHSLAADFDYDTNTLSMKESNSPDLDQHPILPKNPFIRVTASPSASISTSSASIDQESSSSLAAIRQSQTFVEDQEVNMLATLPSSIGGLGHMFQGCGTSGNNPAAVQMRLQQLKTSPMLNPHYCMIQR